jgi:predicted membrane-bound spermidine synthase
MACARCGDPDSETGRRWCAACERAYDVWSRRHASDVAWAALAGTVVVTFGGMVLPLLGLSWLAAAAGVFAGFGAFVGLYRLNARRRRRQYLRTGEVPRAYLPGKA